MSDIIASISNGINILGTVLANSVRGALSNSAAGCNRCDLNLFGTSTPPITSPPLINRFDNDDSDNWIISSWPNKSADFANTWARSNVKFANGKLILSITNSWCPALCDWHDYSAGEYSTRAHNFAEGSYRVRLKAAKGAGVITAFSIHNDEPHDEVDTEIRGIKCREAQLNYFNNGQGGHEKIITLPFDACADFHDYSLVWQPDSITWLVDGNQIHRVEGENLPAHPGRMIFNVWAINSSNQELVDWAGRFNPSNLPIEAVFDEVEFSPAQ